MGETFLSARWENLIMANYEVDPAVLSPYLPTGVALDLYGGKAFVSLVGFLFKNTRLFGLPVPFLGTFEEINLRFYVKRVEGDLVKRGVVFVNETVPYQPVAWLANKLYKEHYVAVPTRHHVQSEAATKHVRYEWKVKGKWNHIAVTADTVGKPMAHESAEEFIFEHYFGYTRLSDQRSQEYRVSHPRWNVNTVLAHSIDCDFRAMYGDRFASLQGTQPASVLLAEGSPVTVKWKRETF